MRILEYLKFCKTSTNKPIMKNKNKKIKVNLRAFKRQKHTTQKHFPLNIQTLKTKEEKVWYRVHTNTKCKKVKGRILHKRVQRKNNDQIRRKK